MKLNGRLHVVSKDGKPEVEGVLRLFYEGLRNITISHFAVKRFFDEYGHAKASLKLLKWHKEWLEEEIRKCKLLIEGGYDLQSYRDDLKELEADYKLIQKLIQKLEREEEERKKRLAEYVKHLSEQEEQEVLEAVNDELDYFAWQEEFRDERGDVE